jgi:hypothetical protein
MVTTGDTYLASQTGAVGIGTTKPGGKLHVKGDVIIEGNILMTGTIAGYQSGEDAEARHAAPSAAAAGQAEPTSATAGLYGLCQELVGFPTQTQMSCRKKTLTIFPASCDPAAGQLRCVCVSGYELVALSVSAPMTTSVDPKNRKTRGLENLLNDQNSAPVVTYSCLKK